MVITATDVAEGRVLQRAIAGATVLQVIGSLKDEPAARTAVAIAHALVRAGARALVAAPNGPLVRTLTDFGGEWIDFPDERAGRRAAERLKALLATERIDLVHAKTATSARVAVEARRQRPLPLVTDLPDLPRQRMRTASWLRSALSAGDRVITRSLHHAEPMIALHKIAPERLAVIPHGVDANLFHPSQVSGERVARLRQSWGVPSGVRVALTPGAVGPGNGQIALVEAAKRLSDHGVRDVAFVLAGDDRRHKLHALRLMRRAQKQGVHALFRMAGATPDLPAAYAAADVVVLPYVTPPLYGQALAEAQSMARPVVVTDVGALAEQVAAPPLMPADVRTGWVVSPGDPEALAQALREALSLDPKSYRALAARAHHFGEAMFSPARVAAATLDVYRALLAAAV